MYNKFYGVPGTRHHHLHQVYTYPEWGGRKFIAPNISFISIERYLSSSQGIFGKIVSSFAPKNLSCMSWRVMMHRSHILLTQLISPKSARRLNSNSIWQSYSSVFTIVNRSSRFSTFWKNALSQNKKISRRSAVPYENFHCMVNLVYEIILELCAVVIYDRVVTRVVGLFTSRRRVISHNE